MRCKSLLLGGAMALALTGAAFAQAASGADPNSQPAAQSQATPQSSDTSATGTSTSQTSKPATHHMRHHMHHHAARTASLHAPSSPAEKQQTNELNQQQLQMATAAANQSARVPGSQAANGANGPAINRSGAHPAGTPAGYTQDQNGTPQGSMQSGTYTQPSGAAAPGSEPGNAAYSRPSPNGQPATGSQAAPGSEPGNAGPYYQQPQGGGSEPGPSYMSAPGANGPIGAPGNPTTPTDQNAPQPNQNPPNQPGPSS